MQQNPGGSPGVLLLLLRGSRWPARGTIGLA